MKIHGITRQLKSIAPDVLCIWNGVIDRWQVYQRTTGHLIQLDGQRRHDLKLMWTCQTERGDYLEPSDADIKKLITTVSQSHELWSGNVDQIATAAETYELHKERQLTPSVKEAMGEVIEAAWWSKHKYGRVI